MKNTTGKILLSGTIAMVAISTLAFAQTPSLTIQSAIENGDYNAFIESVQWTRLEEKNISQEIFEKIVERYNTTWSIKKNKKKDNLEERKEKPSEEEREAKKAQHEAVKTTIENNDYNAFMTLVADTPFAEKITTEAQFALLVQMHTSMQAGDTETAESIANELGLQKKMRWHGKNKGQKGREKGREKNKQEAVTQE